MAVIIACDGIVRVFMRLEGSFLRKDVLTGWQLAFAYSKQDLRVDFTP